MHAPFTHVKDYFGPYSLRGLKTIPGRDTDAFDATLLKDGKPVAHSGSGGMHIFSWNKGWQDPEAEAFRAFALSRPVKKHPLFGEMRPSEELFTWDLVGWTQFHKKNKKALTTSIFAQVGEKPPQAELPPPELTQRRPKKGDQPFIGGDVFAIYGLPPTPENIAKVQEVLAKEYPGQRVRILNEEVA